MTELGYVELPFIRTLRELGWEYRTESQLDEYDRPADDPIIERLLVAAILRINPAVKSNEQAGKAVDLLRGMLSDPDPLAANRRALDALRDGVPVVIEPGQPAVTVQFFEFDPAKQDRNSFVISNQFTVKGTATCRADLVLLVNGIPLVLCEFKSYLSAGKDWKEGVRQLHRYMREAPRLLVPNVLCVTADEDELRYGTIHFRPETEQVVRGQMDSWRPWLSLYPEVRGYWNLKAGEPEQLGLTAPGDYALFTVVRGFADHADRDAQVRAARGIGEQLRRQKALVAGWSDTSGGRKKLRTVLMAACWQPELEALKLCPEDEDEPKFLTDAMEELARAVS